MTVAYVSFVFKKNQIKMLNLIMNIHDWSASALSIKLLQNVIAASTGPVSVISFYVYVIQTNFALVDSNGWWTGLGYVAI